MKGKIVKHVDFLNLESFRIETPEGTLYVDIVENDDGVPCQMIIHGPKTGTPLAAWCDAIARAFNIAMKAGVNWVEFIEQFSNITTSRAVRLISGVTARSGPEGVAIALMRYKDSKAEKTIKEIEEIVELDEEDLDIRPRWRRR